MIEDYCRVYWASHGCVLPRGHEGRRHVCECGATPEMGYMFGEDTTVEERAEMD